MSLQVLEPMTEKLNPKFVEISNLVKAYPNPYGDDFRVVEDFNLNIRQGEFISLIGHSGCGKSTVLTMLAGLNEISDGGIIVGNREIDGPGPDRAVVFQAPCLMPWLSAFGNVMLGVKSVYPHASKAEQKQIVEHSLSIVGLGDSMKKYPKELSGGMQQRVGIARAIALQPKVLLLDEPFGRLDSLTRMELQDVIIDILARENLTALIVTHDVDEAVFMADRCVMMSNGPKAGVGEIMEIDFPRPRDRESVFNDPMFFQYREHLLAFLEQRSHIKGETRVHTKDNLTGYMNKAELTNLEQKLSVA
ncbi:ABC transporter ATP-binding protein [Roseibacillus persicicus]|uniref:Nitrate ABC transporter ATP-binding protein n=2 Tax=Roseibacillus persicicus TaxID=454148 RepID=A0A918THN0_9BACT|nr:ABC transporter ATP-binding protein [Roseibacillus persicicus]GHC49639.1 nitrate ABC transporter ATP-binding protein [Roseibacillus persicicus]